MKPKHLLIVALLLVSLFLLGFTQAKPTVYEYKLEYSPKEKKVNQLAGEGWEVVAVGAESTTTVTLSVFVFKRPKPNQ